MKTELESMIRESLGDNYDPGKIAAVKDLEAALDAQRRDVEVQVRLGKLSGRAFADATNTIINEYLGKIAEVLGEKDYVTVFGLPPGEPIGVIDPSIAEYEDYER
jgi:hypothetical protein